MTRAQNNTLRYAFKEYKNGKNSCMPYSVASESLLEARTAVEGLNDNGHIHVSSYAIGCVAFELTEQGIIYCSETYG